MLRLVHLSSGESGKVLTNSSKAPELPSIKTGLGGEGATGLYLGIGFFLLLMGLIVTLSWLFEPS